MASSPLHACLLGALIGLVPFSAQAVVEGHTSRDPSGLRASVVRVESSQGEICSGTLIGQDLVLTAAHCVMRKASYTVYVVDPLSLIHI